MRLNGTNAYTSIKLGDKNEVPDRVQVLRVGKFQHPQYGKFEITTQTLSEMKKNFDSRVRGIDVSFDYYHDSDEDASAWVKALELSDDGQALWAIVDWTPKATQKLSDRELRYFSPDFTFEWKDPESGSVHKNVLFGGGLTNRPFVKEMKAIVANEKHKGLEMTELEKSQARVKELETVNVKLSEEKSDMEKKLAMGPNPDKIKSLEDQIAALQAELAKEKLATESMLAEKVKADEAKALAEKETEFNVLLTEGKAVAAQKPAFLSGNMTEFIKLAQPVNLKGGGSSSTVTGDDKVAAILKLAEEKRKANPKLGHGESISIAKKEIEKN